MAYPPRLPHHFIVLLLTAAATGPSCRTADAQPSRAPIVQPGPPGEPGRVITPNEAVELSRVEHTDADVRFMQGMIGHHAQALEMTALLPSRSAREEMRLLAQRIEVSQADEIDMMKSWLEARGQEVPADHAHHTPGAPLMPGMLTPDEMSGLAAETGDAFDRLFLQLMIKHHEGALTMVDQLFASPGAGQESEIFTFVSDVEADQRMEIQRMGGMLDSFREIEK